MSEKKYSPHEAAIAVLKKAEELLKKSEVLQSKTLAKAEKSKHDRCVEDVERNSPEVKNPHAVCVAEGVKPAKWEKSEKDTENKKEPSNPEHPRIKEEAQERDYNDFETKPGSSKSSDDHRQAEQASPEDNPKEAAEGNNELWGTQPSTYGHLKLAHFMGRMAEKRRAKQPAEKPMPETNKDFAAKPPKA